MLSRRSVRVKVMQLLYSQDRDEAVSDKDLVKTYHEFTNRSYELFLFSLYVIMKICECSSADLKKRQAKLLPSDYDKAFTDKLQSNAQIADLIHNAIIGKKFEKLGFESKVNSDYLAKIYDQFSKKEEYKNFISSDTGRVETIELLLEMYRFCRQDEYFNEMLEDAFYNWSDDKSLVVGAVKKYLKALPSPDRKLHESFIPDDETVKEFGLELLKRSTANKEEIMEVIIPVLENWDHERLAVVDTILLRMALCEMLHFPTIPSKVTLNEYVELAKQYSTIKSKEFINGILDKLMKNLTETGKLSKEGRGLVE